MTAYRGRLAPSPTGCLHLGHARTFWTAQERARRNGGRLILRNEDLDRDRCRPEFLAAMVEDLRWFGFEWDEGPDVGGEHGPYDQSLRMEKYRDAFVRLRNQGALYPCTCSRKDIRFALSAPHAADDEPVYPGTCRSRFAGDEALASARTSWRFRVPDGEEVGFIDERLGPQCFVAGRDFGDFVIWRRGTGVGSRAAADTGARPALQDQDGVPAYQLAVVVDDAAMGITEVVRGADLLVSTARQLLLYRALGLAPPAFHHCALVTDDKGIRLAKRHDALSLRTLRLQNHDPARLRAGW
jgi:glutamyl/glutaminyl-tRNA synthetase